MKQHLKRLFSARPFTKTFLVSVTLISLAGLGAFFLVHLPSTIRTVHAHSLSRADSGVAFGPTIPNTQPPPAKIPKGMVWIPGGEFSMGAQDPPDMDMVGMKATRDSRPIHRVYVDGFFMDKTDVTNAQFAEFVKATGYITVAEKTPTAADFPGALPENLDCGRRSLLSAESCCSSQ